MSPLCLGTATFGSDWGWGTEETVARTLFNYYVDNGGNFVDTADNYTKGNSESMLGRFIDEMRLRDKIVISTKFSTSSDPDNPNAGGNGRKNIFRAIEGSLRRLRTDYIDIYVLHGWDTVTPAVEVISTLSDLVREGKIRYYGLSDVPAWYMAHTKALADRQGIHGFIAVQLQYSLLERNIEREHVPCAQEFGLAVCPYSPLAMGFLSGKYNRGEPKCDGRLSKMIPSPLKQFSDHNWQLLAVISDMASRIGRQMSEVALNWVATQPGVTSTLIGATSVSQLKENLEAITFKIPTEYRAHLDEFTHLEPQYPYELFRAQSI